MKGIDAGYRGVVKEIPDTPPHEGSFLVRMEYEKREDALRIVSPGNCLYLEDKAFRVPKWMPPLSTDDNASIHEEFLLNVSQIGAAQGSQALARSLTWIIERCWRLRLPVAGADIWPLMEAHGVLVTAKADIIHNFDFGVDLLTAAFGRRAIKRKRMPAMSKGRYLTKRHRDFLSHLRGQETGDTE